MGRRAITDLSVTEFARFVDQRMEELGVKRTLPIRNSGMTASGISQILKKGRGSNPYSINYMAVALNAPQKNYSVGRIPAPPSRTGRCNRDERA